jgi:hypothetical protein
MNFPNFLHLELLEYFSFEKSWADWPNLAGERVKINHIMEFCKCSFFLGLGVDVNRTSNVATIALMQCVICG